MQSFIFSTFFISIGKNSHQFKIFFLTIILFYEFFLLIYRNILKLSNLKPVSRINILTVSFIMMTENPYGTYNKPRSLVWMMELPNAYYNRSLALRN